MAHDPDFDLFLNKAAIHGHQEQPLCVTVRLTPMQALALLSEIAETTIPSPFDIIRHQLVAALGVGIGSERRDPVVSPWTEGSGA